MRHVHLHIQVLKNLTSEFGLSTSNLPSVGKGSDLVSPVTAAYTDTNRIEHNFLPRSYTNADWSGVQ